MAIIRKLDVAFTGTGASAPKLTKIDRMESAGSLLLVDLTNSYRTIPAGVPANGQILPNLFNENLAAVTGVSAALDATFVHSAATPARLNLERTVKGGLHAIVQQTTGVAVVDYAYLSMPQALLDFMNAHKDHHYYFSLWQRTTRATTYSSGSFSPNYAQFGFASGNPVTLLLSTVGPLGQVAITNFNSILPNATQNHLFAAEIPLVQSVGLASIRTYPFLAGGFGGYNSSGTSNSQDKLPSQILYRTYLEDLTVSGRTYAQVFAIDNTLYQKEVLTEGGRYYGDTFTNPSSVTFP